MDLPVFPQRTAPIVYSLKFEAVTVSHRSDKIPTQLMSFLFITALISHTF